MLAIRALIRQCVTRWLTLGILLIIFSLKYHSLPKLSSNNFLSRFACPPFCNTILNHTYLHILDVGPSPGTDLADPFIRYMDRPPLRFLDEAIESIRNSSRAIANSQLPDNHKSILLAALSDAEEEITLLRYRVGDVTDVGFNYTRKQLAKLDHLRDVLLDLSDDIPAWKKGQARKEIDSVLIPSMLGIPPTLTKLEFRIPSTRADEPDETHMIRLWVLERAERLLQAAMEKIQQTGTTQLGLIGRILCFFSRDCDQAVPDLQLFDETIQSLDKIKGGAHFLDRGIERLIVYCISQPESGKAYLLFADDFSMAMITEVVTMNIRNIEVIDNHLKTLNREL